VALTITFVTSNSNKVRAVLEHTEPFGVNVVHKMLPLVEPQADTIEEVALSKAKQAYQQCAAPVLVEDGGFCIDELSGFPGPYTKYVLQTIGVGGLLRLTHDLPLRTCQFRSVMVYIDEHEQAHTFVDDRGVGVLAMEIDTTPCPEAWSELWRIFIAEGATKPMTALSPGERGGLFLKWQSASVYTRFGAWYRQEHISS
jgi:non-canonical purine NTP pyrophosphatase (RdgB/HAM1 family)